MVNNMSEDIKNNYSEFYKVILSLQTESDAEEFFSDLLTRKELDSFTQRITAGKLLKKGETYEKVISKTNISSATLSRVSRALKYGTGYKKFL
jgi:TrpR-related protein YerC/YecD